MSSTQNEQPDPKWIELQKRACKLARKLTQAPQAPEWLRAIEWFNSDYSESAVRERREAAEISIHAMERSRPSAWQVSLGDDFAAIAIARLSSALIDIRQSAIRFGNVEGWENRETERIEAAKVILIVALVVDRDADLYLDDRIDLARVSKGGDDDTLGRGFAGSSAGFDEGDGPWLKFVEGALDVLDRAPDKSNLECSEFALRDDDLSILCEVHSRQRLVKASELDGLSGMPSKSRLHARLNAMERASPPFVERPDGERSGFRLTAHGVETLRSRKLIDNSGP